MKYLLIAEKPSLMRDIQACYRKHTSEIVNKVGEIEFVALRGHLCGIYEPNEYDEWADLAWSDVDYPMIPVQWKIKFINNDYNRKALAIIKSKVKECDGIIVATDADVEGYGIYYLLEKYLHLENKKALRFLEQSQTDAEILSSLLSMRDIHTDPLHKRFTQAFLIRSRADWLYGMNMTRVMSVKQGETLNIGRVKAPTIKLVYDNSMAIENFSKKKYYHLLADYGQFTSTLIDDKGLPVQLDSKEEFPNVSLEGIVKAKKTERTATHAPKLYHLTALQAEAEQTYKLSPDKTMEIIQSLYEKHKVVSYPRTSCRYVSFEKSKQFPRMLSQMTVFEDLRPIAESITNDDIKRVMGDKMVVNDAEVKKEAHDALLPTLTTPNLNAMTSDEIKICHMIYKRLLSQFLPKLEEDKTQMLITHDNKNFIAKGKSIVNQGWRILYSEAKESYIPNLKEGDKINAKKIEPVERVTRPPKRLTTGTLGSAMENIANQIEDKELRKSLAQSQGIGTTATRTKIISDIIELGYFDNKKDGLYITDKGKFYIESLKNIEIISPVFAAIMDTDIKKVQRGEADYNTIYNKIVNDLKYMCKKVEKLEGKKSSLETKEMCPVCGSFLLNERFEYKCPKCSLKLQKNICGVTIDESILGDLLDGKVTKMYTFKKKDGSTFDARLKLKQGENNDYKIDFNFSSGIVCPVCRQAYVNINKGGAFCESPNCDLKIYRKVAQHELTNKEITSLLTKRKITGITDFVNKKGETFAADLVLDAGKVSFKYIN